MGDFGIVRIWFLTWCDFLTCDIDNSKHSKIMYLKHSSLHNSYYLTYVPTLIANAKGYNDAWQVYYKECVSIVIK